MADFSPFAGRALPDWFAPPQLGVFVHWGIFSVPAWAPAGVSISDLFRSDYERAMAVSPYAEWYWNAMRVPGSPTEAYHRTHHQGAPYEAFRPAFDAAARAADPERWADLMAAAGARYCVFVTKHHDGYCLWPTDVANPHKPGWNAERDFVGELAAAVRRRGLRFGIYYSGGLDWTFRWTPISSFGDMFACVPTEADYRAYALAQAKELIDRYAPSVFWNDIAWPDAEGVAELFSHYYARVPDGVVNDRWMSATSFFESLRDPTARAGFDAMVKARTAARAEKDGADHGSSRAPPHCDFRTVEYEAGPAAGGQKWELCRGVGLAFGYNRAERTEDFLTAADAQTLLRDVVARGGSLLLNLGPMANGDIPDAQRIALAGLAAR